ncbi:TM0106 family RecB-like putative nuclease [Mycobacterium sp. UM_WGJ]|uniref:TM0106 family RecB-like putative nuclease n=1 Tax=Mycobacterium sp. UM_WGJ TaxID=1370120 RepID=UPI0004075424|nr:TM0106 family RecB-like putative nuclease [Mycobacterium sp. UM_WGJ]
MSDLIPTEYLLTPSKITAWLDCAHYLTLRNQVDGGTLPQPRSTFGEFAKLLLDKGLQHEQQCLDEYRANRKSVLEVPARGRGETFQSWVARVGNPFDDGWDIIYQMPFIHDGVRGIADFLVRTADGGYEPVDAKLARAEAKPGHVLQLCFYADALEALTGVRPEHMHLWLGSGKTETLRVNDFSPYWRRLRKQLTETLAGGPEAGTVPRPCAYCDFCEFRTLCDQQWRDEGALSLVAGIRAPETATLEIAGIPNMTALAQAQTPVEGLGPRRLQRLTEQARLQIEAALLGEDAAPPFQLIEPGEDPMWGHGFEELPRPDDGDVFLDFEGHPFWRVETGLFFLFGLLERDSDRQWHYREWRAHDLEAEAVAAAELIDYLVQRRAAFPEMHVYHYNHTERSSLVTLAEKHNVAQRALAELIETGLFVDLLLVARNSIQVGTESYGLKALERLTDFQRSHDIDKGAGAVLQYEEFMKHGGQARLDRIAVYNEDDVRATMALRDWLVQHRPAELAWRESVLEPDPGLPELDVHVEQLHAFPADTSEYLLGDLLGYWRREWFAYIGPKMAKLQGDTTALRDDPEALTELQYVGEVERLGKTGKPITPGLRFVFPPQSLHRFPYDGGSVMFVDAEGQRFSCAIENLDRRNHLLDLQWGTKVREAGILPPSVVLLHDWIGPEPKREALSGFAAQLLDGADTNPVTMALLRRELPCFTDGAGPLGGLFTDDLADMRRWVTKLDNSFVAIQGPPGAGKTYSAARLIRTLILEGRRVGVTATTHHAVDHLLKKVVELFRDNGDIDKLNAVKKPKSGSTWVPDGTTAGSKTKCARRDVNLVAGTTWLFGSKEMRNSPVDVLLIDEAGQVSLADALAASLSARNVVLLGDPLQLSQVAQASHPNDSGRSVLEHILGEAAIMPRDRGVFLSKTYRMHPDVCRFISEEIYAGQLGHDSSCEQQNTVAGTGLRWLRAEHRGNSTSSEQEAELIAAEIARLVGTIWTDEDGDENPLTVSDFMVVAPFNHQVRMIRDRLDADASTRGVAVGTVDKFQGGEAAVVFFSMTTSTGEDISRGADFLFSRNRLNVAISRARCLAYLVCTEELLNARARNVEDMRLIATLNAVVEYVERGHGAGAST